MKRWTLILVTALGCGSARDKQIAPNTPPLWGPYVFLGDDLGIYSPWDCVLDPSRCNDCPGPSCELGSGPSVYIQALCGPDDDVVTVDVEIVPFGLPLTKRPTDSLSGQVGREQAPSGRCVSAVAHCSCFQVPATGLAPGTSYRFAVRVTDAMGAVGPFPDAPDGWASPPDWTFKTRP